MKHLFFVAGESSGDTHGANLIRALRRLDSSVSCAGLGGHAMAAAGMELRHDLAGQAIMGFTEVVKQLPAIRRLFLDTVAHLRTARPDVLVLIDYPGFNIRLAKAAHGLGIPVIYYISPQVWAWKKQRIHTLARYVGKMLVILPFEKTLYEAVGLPCAYVGHPLLDHVAAYQAPPRGEELVIGILPGSRAQEIERLLPVMAAIARGIQERYPEARFHVPCVNEKRAAQVRALAGGFPIEIRIGGMYDVLSAARFCLVASGTATLETALFGVPFVIMYKVGRLNYWLARWLVRGITHIGIVNILADRGIVPEFIQGAAAPDKVLPVALDLIAETPAREQMIADLRALRQSLGEGGASEHAAREILDFLEARPAVAPD